ncbi:MAG: substrate-binding domain-containing protein, partial [Candidatus Geothermincolales bacterium]
KDLRRARAGAQNMIPTTTGAARAVGLVLGHILLALGLATASCRGGGGREVILATTTSVQETGLIDLWVSMFEEESPYRVKVIAVGSGQAMEMGRRGKCDLMLVHSPEDEEEMVREGYAVNRQPVMYNEFVLVGPPDDPAGAREAGNAAEAMRRIAGSGRGFVSRGDGSGTHAKELALWELAGVEPEGGWYLETGKGMGDTLRAASEKGAYCLCDEGTFLVLRDELDLEVLFRGDPTLFNYYHVMEVDPGRWPDVNSEGARRFSEFIRGERAQAVLLSFGKEKYGKPLFVPCALGERAGGEG